MIKIGVSGDVGSFSERAALNYIALNNIKDVQIEYLVNMENVLLALDKGVIDNGVFPVANSIVGLITPALIAMGRHNFTLVTKIDLSVEHYLYAKTYLEPGAITHIYSFGPAIEQCKHYIEREFPSTTIIDWGDMALAAKDVAQGIITGNVAVIGPKSAAEKYNLKILAEKIQDDEENKTMFVVVKSFEV